MIRLTRINHTPFVLNSDLIEHVEVTPDTVISLTNGQKFVVLESSDEVVARVVQFRRAIHDSYIRQQTEDTEDEEAPAEEPEMTEDS